jgi:hypothetical protein
MFLSIQTLCTSAGGVSVSQANSCTHEAHKLQVALTGRHTCIILQAVACFYLGNENIVEAVYIGDKVKKSAFFIYILQAKLIRALSPRTLEIPPSPSPCARTVYSRTVYLLSATLHNLWPWSHLPYNSLLS